MDEQNEERADARNLLKWTRERCADGTVDLVTRDAGGFRIAEGYDEAARLERGEKYSLLRGIAPTTSGDRAGLPDGKMLRDTGETFSTLADAKRRAEELAAAERKCDTCGVEPATIARGRIARCARCDREVMGKVSP